MIMILPLFISPTRAIGSAGVAAAGIGAAGMSIYGYRSEGKDTGRLANRGSVTYTLGSAISVSLLHSMYSKCLVANFPKPLSHDFNRLGEKWANRRLYFTLRFSIAHLPCS